MTSPRSASTSDTRSSLLWRMLTLEQMTTGSLVHLVYWFGLGVISLGGFGAIGGGVGTALREGVPMGILLGIAIAAAGLLVTAAMAIVWRSFCEFYVVIIGIGEDLRALRRRVDSDPAFAAVEGDATPPAPPASARRRRSPADRDQ